MTRSHRARTSRASARGPNFIAILISFAAVSVLYFNFHPTPVGAGPETAPTSIGEVAAAVSVAAPVPAPRPVVSISTAEGDAKSSAPAAQSGPEVLNGRMALLLNLLLAERGCRFLEDVPDYTATFYKQEVIDGELGDGQVMQLKLRHSPFSVYMKWLVGDKGRELLYVEGQNDGEMIVHPGGWKARLLPAIKLNPTGSLAMSEARYPVTKVGLLELARTVVEFRKRDLERSNGVRCQMIADQEFDGRECYFFTIEWETPEVSKLYRKCQMYLDEELSVPVYVKNFTWPAEPGDLTDAELDTATMIEHYTFTNIKFEQRLADNDFDQANAEYKFRR